MNPWVAVFAFFVPAVAWAGGFQMVEQSAAAGGTAGAGIVRADDPAAAWYGPASTVRGDGWRFGAGMLAVAPNVEARAIDGTWRERTEPALKTPPQLYATWVRGRFAAGASVNVPFGSGVAWPAGWEGRYEIVSSSLQVIRAQPFAAWRAGRFSFAAGPHLDQARMQVARRVDFVDAEGDVAIDLAGIGAGAHAAVHWEGERLAVGATWKSRTTIPLRGTADFEVPDAFTAKAHDQRARSEITMPDVYAIGLAWRASARVTVLADAGVTDWSSYDAVTIDFEDPDTADVTNRPRWEPRPWLRAGAEARVGKGGAVRAGLLADPSPAPDDTLAPSSPDSHRVGATLGAGLRVGRGATVDAFYEYLRLLDRKTTSEEALPARYRGEAHFVGVGVRIAR